METMYTSCNKNNNSTIDYEAILNRMNFEFCTSGKSDVGNSDAEREE